MAYIPIDENIFFTTLFIIFGLGLWTLISMIFAFNYTMTAAWCNLTKRRMGIIVDNNGNGRFAGLIPEKKSDHEFVRDKKLNGSWQITANSMIRLPMVKAYILLTELDKSVPMRTAYSTTLLERMGFKDIKVALNYLYDTLQASRLSQLICEGRKPESDLEVLSIQREIDAAKNRILDSGGIDGDPYTIHLGSVMRFYLSTSNPVKRRNINQTYEAEVMLGVAERVMKALKGDFVGVAMKIIMVVFAAGIVGMIIIAVLNAVNHPMAAVQAASNVTATLPQLPTL